MMGKDLPLILGNMLFLHEQKEPASLVFKQTLVENQNSNPLLSAYILNNLAFTSWMRVMEIPKIEDENEK